jgi:methylmalonyl-CoA/ethylmalonyl-CoA epimerase
MDELIKRGKRVLDKKPKIGAHGNLVIFIHPKDMGGVLVELEQVPSSSSCAKSTTL